MGKKQFPLTISLLNEIAPLSEVFKDFLKLRIGREQVKKGEFLNRAGQICERIFVIRKGLLRGYFESGGKEITTWISCEREIATSISGFFQHKPSRENIQALENTSLEYLTYEDLMDCLERFPEMSIIYRSLLVQYYIMAEDRAFVARIPGALERYKYFVNSGHRHLVQRVPYKYLSSLLGIRPETFSRIIRDS